MNKKLLLSLPCVVWLVAAVVVQVPNHGSSAYNYGLIIGRAVAPCLPLLALVRIWNGPEVSRELGEHGWQYGVAFLLVAALGAGVGLARTAPTAGLTRTQATIEAGFTDGCAAKAPRPLCECIAKQLVERQGVDTAAELLQMQPAILRAQASGSVADVPASIRAAGEACAQQFQTS